MTLRADQRPGDGNGQEDLYALARSLGKKQRDRDVRNLAAGFVAAFLVGLLIALIFWGRLSDILVGIEQQTAELHAQNEELDEAFAAARVEQVRAEFRQQQLLAEFEKRLVPRSEVVALRATNRRLERQVSILTRQVRELNRRLANAGSG
jgi:uncharacterized membrane protein YciS (DUF1049 family)